MTNAMLDQRSGTQGNAMMWDGPKPQQPWYRQPGYRPTNFMLDAANKAAGVVSDFVWPILNGDLHRAANEYELGGRGDQELPRQSMNAAGGAMVGSSFAPRAPVNALRSGAARSGLDMSQAERLQRAKDMGFDTDTVYYHGTRRDFDRFDRSEIDSATDTGNGFGFFKTTDKSDADFYADGVNEANPVGGAYEGGRIIPTFERVENPLVIDTASPPSWLNPQHVYDNDGTGTWDNSARLIEKHAINGGHDAVRIKYVDFDGIPQTLSVTRDPNSSRSVNAAFDPYRASSSNLLASNPFTGAVVPMYAGGDE